MTLPTILLGILISSLYGTLFHLWRGGNLGKLILYLVMSWSGFWLGQFIATQLDWTFFSYGQLHLGMATLFSFLFLAIGFWLSRTERARAT